MLFCGNCGCKVSVEINIENIPADYSVNVLTNSLNLVLCSLGYFENINIVGFKCPSCNKKIESQDLYVRSQISQKLDKITEFIIVAVRHKKEEVIDGKIVLVIPPKIIHKSELKKFKEYNPYNDDKYIITSPLDSIDVISPK